MLNTKLTQNFEECIKDYFLELIDRGRSIEYEVVESDFGIRTPVRPFQEDASIHAVVRIPKGYDPGNPGFKVLICWELCHFISPFDPFKVYEARMPVNMVEMWQELPRLGFIEDTPKVRRE